MSQCGDSGTNADHKRERRGQQAIRNSRATDRGGENAANDDAIMTPRNEDGHQAAMTLAFESA